jgi:hypothetical protein
LTMTMTRMTHLLSGGFALVLTFDKHLPYDYDETAGPGSTACAGNFARRALSR